MILLDIEENEIPKIDAIRISPVVANGCLHSGEIKDILNQINKLELTPIRTVGESEKDFRSCKIAWLPYDDEYAWIYGRLYDVALWINQDTFKFEPLHFTEPIMYCEWQVDDHFDWHTDTGNEYPFSNRKLAISVQLSESDDYRGGNLEFAITPNPNSWFTVTRGEGSVIVYPGYLAHRVQPITKGIRKSLVFWLGGEPLK